MDHVMLEELRNTTQDLIGEFGERVALIRPAREHDISGQLVYEGDDPIHAADRFFAAVTSDPPLVLSVNGKQVQVNHVLVGFPQDDIRKGDFFEKDERRYEVVAVHPDSLDFETRAWLIERV